MTESTAKHPSAVSETPTTTAPISTKPIVSEKTRKTTIIVGSIVAVVVIAALVGLGYLMYRSYDWAGNATPATVRLRDMAFVVIALETLVLMVLVLIVIVLLMIVIVLLYDRLIPVLEQTNRTVNTVADTVHTVRGTTTFVSDRVVTPFIEVSGYVAGAARIVKEIVGLWPKNKSSSTQQEPPAVTE